MPTENGALNQRIRELLKPGAGLIMPGAGNALTARIIERSGFELMLLSGAAVANTYLGVPDVGLVSLTELADHVAAIRSAIAIPIVVDADTGFGNAVNVVRTVQVLERAGANAIMLEDQTSPKRCGHFDGKDVVSCAEMVQKIRAAVDARVDSRMMIMARTDARAVEGLEAACDRARAYQEAGADFLFIEAPRSVEELAAIPRSVPGLHVCNMVIGGKTPVLPREDLAKMGYAVIAYANAALQASMLAMQTVLGHLRSQGGIEGVKDKLVMFDERQAILEHERFKELEMRYRHS